MATPTIEDRRKLAKSGVAMPDGSYYIRNAGELDDAISAVGRATPNAGESETARRNSVRRHIIRRARALNLTSKIPDSWNPDGSLKHSAMIAEILVHYGVIGMKWGRRRRRSASSSSNPMSSEAARATRLQTRAQTHGSKSLSNQELQHLVTRMNLENQYGRLSPTQVSTGKKIALGLLVAGGAVGASVAKQTAASFASKYAAQGVEALIKAAAAKKG